MAKTEKPGRAVALAKEYLLANPYATNEDVVKVLGISPRSVTTARQFLYQAGVLQRNSHDRRSTISGDPVPDASPGPDVLTTSPAVSLAELQEVVAKDHGQPLTVDQMRQRYSAIARWAATKQEFKLEIDSMQALARLDAQTGARDKLGPGVPHTREQRVERAGLIFEACGPSVGAEAACKAFSDNELRRFIDEIGRFMARKAPNGQSTAQNDPKSDQNGSSDPLSTASKDFSEPQVVASTADSGSVPPEAP